MNVAPATGSGRTFVLNLGCECNRLCLLKKSVFFKTAKFWGMENV
jgi:hypothetical protein